MNNSSIGLARAPGFALAVFLVCGASVWAGNQAKPAKPVCAIIDVDRSPRAALLEAKLLADMHANWVERNVIDGVLKEQILQAAFGPQGGADRVRLGKLLKADLLVLVRSAKSTKEAALELVISDTARGLRLAMRAVPVTQDADSDVAALRGVVEAGLKRFREEVREVVAVPPFASGNLEYAHDHLKGAYAKLIEQAALANPGVVVVELAEAEAIAREIKLADPFDTVERPLPLYLLGEFRHQGRGAELTVAFQFHAARGGQRVGAASAQVVAPVEAPAALRKWTADRLVASEIRPIPPADSKTEAKQLAELSRSRQRVGDWVDALALLEASLLLDSNQPELNADAMVLLKLRIEQVVGPGKKDIDLLRRAAQLHRRGFEHMESLIASGAKLARFGDKPDSVRGGRMFQSPFPFPIRLPPNSPVMLQPEPAEVQDLVRELQRERRAICMRLLPAIVKSGTAHEVVTFTSIALWELSTAERYAETARLTLAYQDYPTMVAAVDWFVYLAPHSLALEELPAYRKLLDRLEMEGNAGVRARAKRARQELPNIEKGMAKLAEREAEQRRLAEAVAKKLAAKSPLRLTKEERANELDERLKGGPLRPIRLKSESADDEQLLDYLGGVVAAGAGVDIFWGWGSFRTSKPMEGAVARKAPFTPTRTGPVLLMMKEKGMLRRVWEKPGTPEKINSICFDGRYVWAALDGYRQAPALFVFDPIAEKACEVTADDGLPQPPEEFAKDPRRSESLALMLAPLDSGRVCVTGGFGRAWVGVVSFDATKNKATVKVIHEARESPRQNETEKELWRNRNLVFYPMYAHTLRGRSGPDGKTPCRVLIGRRPIIGINNNMAYFGSHPLVVDPDGPTIDVMGDELFPFAARDSAAVADGTLLVAYQPPSTPGKVRLLRVDFPGTVRDLGPLALTRQYGLGPVGVSQAGLHIAVRTPGGVGKSFGSAFWSADLDGKNLRMVNDDLLAIRNFAHSSHYGLVAWCGAVLCEVKAPVASGR